MTRHSNRPTLELLESRTLLATCHVTRLGDIGAGADAGGGHSRGDLRYCITKANTEPGPDVITFSVTGTISLRSPLPDLASDIDMQGPGVNLLTVHRNVTENFRIFNVTAGTVQISGMKIANGYFFGLSTGRGAGIFNQADLTLQRVAIMGNFVQLFSQTSLGGGIYNAGNLTLIESTVDGNGANSSNNFTAYGGGIFNAGWLSIYSSTITYNYAGSGQDFGYGGGIANRGNMVLLNSTVHANAAETSGGGIYAESGPTGTELTVLSHSTISNNQSTVSNNQGGDGGGIRIVSSPTFMRNTIVAGNRGAVGPDVSGTFASSNYNLIGDTADGSGFGPTDILNADPMLAALANNGGPTPTMALLAGSPAIDAGENSDAPEWDQRGPGFPRIVNGRLDIGAYEVQATGMPGANGAWRGSPDPAVALTGGLHLVAWSGDHATTGIVAWSGDHATTGIVAWSGDHATTGGSATTGNAAFMTPLFLSPVHGAFRGAVLGPALTPGDWSRAHQPAPFTGLLGVGLEPRVLPSGQTVEPAINGGPELFALLANILRPFAAEVYS
jgi:hypothetical protein